VSRPLAGLFAILHARSRFPPRSVPNCKQTGLENRAAHSRLPSLLLRNLRTAQSNEAETAGEAQLRHILNELEIGGDFGAKRSVIVRPVCACQGRAPVSRCLHLDSARRAGGLCL
jgi:hypothetical protein